jgi:hypothetical protein
MQTSVLLRVYNARDCPFFCTAAFCPPINFIILYHFYQASIQSSILPASPTRELYENEPYQRVYSASLLPFIPSTNVRLFPWSAPTAGALFLLQSQSLWMTWCFSQEFSGTFLTTDNNLSLLALRCCGTAFTMPYAHSWCMKGFIRFCKSC